MNVCCKFTKTILQSKTGIQKAKLYTVIILNDIKPNYPSTAKNVHSRM